MAKQQKKKKKMRKWIIIGTIVLIVLLLVVAKKAGWIGKQPLEQVMVEKPEVRTIVALITASGKVQPVTEVKISPDVSGEIVQLDIQEGDDVKRGQLLLKIKPDTYISMRDRAEAQLNSSRSQLEQTKAQLVQAEQTYRRQKQLYEGAVISQSDYETAEAQYLALQAQVKAAEFNVESAEAALKEAQENLDKTTIYSPTDGTISLLDVELGERVVGTATMAGTEMLRIADLSAMEVRADVNENDIVRVELGDSTDIEVDAYTGRKFKGIVSRIANSSLDAGVTGSASSDQVTNFEVRIYILPESYADLVTRSSMSPFRPGMSATVDIKTEIRHTLSIPIQSVTTRPGLSGDRKEVVFVLRSDSSLVKQVPVVTGIQDKRFIEVAEGLDSTDQVVTAPFMAISRNLQDGMQVQKTESLNTMAAPAK